MMGKNWAQVNAIRNNVAPPLTPIATNIFLPNHSGDHSAGTTKEPIKDEAIANKAYVDALGVAHLAAYDHTLLANINQDVKTTASPSFMKVSVSAGSAGAPSITFTDDSNLGFYLYGPDQIGIGAGGGNVTTFSGGNIYCNAFVGFASQTATLYSDKANGATAIMCKINGSVNYTTTGAKLFSIQNASVEKAYIDKDGRLGVNDSNLTLSVGSAGSADALPANPSGYFRVTISTGSVLVPYYAEA